jgi:hypothetical protein
VRGVLLVGLGWERVVGCWVGEHTAETSHTTESLRSGVWRDSRFTVVGRVVSDGWVMGCCNGGLTKVGDLAGQVDAVDKDVAVGDLLCTMH